LCTTDLIWSRFHLCRDDRPRCGPEALSQGFVDLPAAAALADRRRSRHPAEKSARGSNARQNPPGQGHTMKLWRIGAIMGAWLTLIAAPDSSAAQGSFPDRPVRVVVPYSAGSVVDVFGRIVTQNMAAQWNGSIILESKSGANGSIAAEEVARAVPDGYTWLMVTTFFTASPSLNVALRWDPVRDFAPIGQICRAPNFFVVPTALPVRNVAEYVALARQKPGALNYSHPGKGSTGHLGFELFKRLAGIDVAGVGYRGYPQMVPDIASGLINSTFLSANQALAQAQTGSIRIIAAISDGRSKYFPEVPTMAEQGFAEAQVMPWFGIVVPAAAPQPIVMRISRALQAALATPEVRQKLDLAGCEPDSAPPAEFAEIIKADIARWAKVVKDAGIPPD
jgi:tripartite-type tricarboxylate transporter receptor subunit TctC